MAEDLDPNKFHIFSPAQRKKIAITTMLLLLVLIPVLGFVYYNFAINRPAQNDKRITVKIEKGLGVSGISKQLRDQNLINSEFLFSFYVVSNHLQNSIQAGVYTIPAGTSIVKLTDLLQHGTDDIRITFLDGWRVEEYAREAVKKFNNIDYEQFIKLAKNDEGYLYPDTYFFNSDASEKDLVQKLQENFTLHTKNVLTESQLQKMGLTMNDAITLASIVEREVANDNDRPIVAGILLKRLKAGALLGADATTQYSVALIAFCAPGLPLNCFDGSKDCNLPNDIRQCLEKYGNTDSQRILSINWWPQSISQEEIQFNSPYNTRVVAGLPPAPISNPGIGAINAVINAKVTDYNFYLTDSHGVTHYAKTLEEHNRNAAIYLK
ncbi:MAG TPA: endolytic transglycosylase MltG [Candidatus Saccharimonadales bacterium]|nr:endolytic transglycosylase MltG [Candidatus Saccharimonadales bacterium]